MAKFVEDLKTLFSKDTMQYQKLKVVFYLVVLGCIVLFGASIYYGVMSYINYQKLNLKTEKLVNLSTYSDKGFELNGSQFEKIVDLNDEFGSLVQQKEELDNKFDTLQVSYNNFLQYIYLPSLNVWKDQYSGKIDTQLLGQNFIKKNPFIDTNLFDYWSWYFKGASEGGQNDIVDMKIGNLEVKEDYFSIPMTVSFSSPNRKTFLMLINRLSVTSDKRNIALINEFVYNLWDVVKDNRKDLIEGHINEEFTKNVGDLAGLIEDGEGFIFEQESEKQTYINEINSIEDIEKLIKYIGKLKQIASDDGFEKVSDIESNLRVLLSEDKIIGKDIMSWISGGSDSTPKFLYQDDIDDAIRKSANCTWLETDSIDQSSMDDACLYEFRTKFNKIANLAYTIGDKEKTNKLASLKEFLSDLPPLIVIDKFTFRKNTDELNIDESGLYYGDISFSVYGKNIQEQEVEEISSELGVACSDKKNVYSKFDLGVAKKIIEAEILKQSSSDQSGSRGYKSDSKRYIDLVDMKDNVIELQSEYKDYTNYEKIVKLFEQYRILRFNNVGCIKNNK